MRKTVSFILLFCLLVYIGGYNLIYAVYQDGLKKEMKAFIKLHQENPFATHFVFNTINGEVKDKDFSWEEKNEEFRYCNELYDVVIIHSESGKVSIECLKDDNENQLESKLQDLKKSNKTNLPSQRNSQIKFFSGFYFEHHECELICKQTTTVKLFYVTAYRLSPYFEINVPPPRC